MGIFWTPRCLTPPSSRRRCLSHTSAAPYLNPYVTWLKTAYRIRRSARGILPPDSRPRTTPKHWRLGISSASYSTASRNSTMQLPASTTEDEMNFQPERWYLIAGSMPIAAAVYYLCSVSVAYRKLPQNVPVHFDRHGVADNWMNRTTWVVLSPIIVGATVALVFATRPTPFIGAAIIYWCVCGVVIGGFLQVNTAAQAQRRPHYLPVLAWLLAVPICEFILSSVFQYWWYSRS